MKKTLLIKTRKNLLSTQDLAFIFNRSTRTIRRWIVRGDLHPIKIGGAVYFDLKEVMKKKKGA